MNGITLRNVKAYGIHVMVTSSFDQSILKEHATDLKECCKRCRRLGMIDFQFKLQDVILKTLACNSSFKGRERFPFERVLDMGTLVDVPTSMMHLQGHK